jgi:hypothetical protein
MNTERRRQFQNIKGGGKSYKVIKTRSEPRTPRVIMEENIEIWFCVE